MNRKIALALVLACSATAAFADEIGTDPSPFTPSATRAQVLQELDAHRKSGVNPYADDYNPLLHFRSDRSRQDVMQEYIQSRDSVAAFTGEDSGSAYLARQRHQQQPVIARQPVTELATAPQIDE